jgi:dihydroxyacetone kinase-like predicted kinase
LAIVSYDKSQSLDKNIASITKAKDNIKIAQIMQAVRNTTLKSYEIKKGNFILNYRVLKGDTKK